MFAPKVKVPKDLYEKVKAAAQEIGCASLEEFVASALEREIERIERARQEEDLADKKRREAEDIASRLQGLGYID